MQKVILILTMTYIFLQAEETDLLVIRHTPTLRGSTAFIKKKKVKRVVNGETISVDTIVGKQIQEIYDTTQFCVKVITDKAVISTVNSILEDTELPSWGRTSCAEYVHYCFYFKNELKKVHSINILCSEDPRIQLLEDFVPTREDSYRAYKIDVPIKACLKSMRANLNEGEYLLSDWKTLKKHPQLEIYISYPSIQNTTYKNFNIDWYAKERAKIIEPLNHFIDTSLLSVDKFDPDEFSGFGASYSGKDFSEISLWVSSDAHETKEFIEKEFSIVDSVTISESPTYEVTLISPFPQDTTLKLQYVDLRDFYYYNCKKIQSK